MAILIVTNYIFAFLVGMLSKIKNMYSVFLSSYKNTPKKNILKLSFDANEFSLKFCMSVSLGISAHSINNTVRKLNDLKRLPLRSTQDNMSAPPKALTQLESQGITGTIITSRCHPKKFASILPLLFT